LFVQRNEENGRQGSARVRNWASEGSGMMGRELGARNREIRPGGSNHHIMDHHSEESFAFAGGSIGKEGAGR